jgi:hypothetical protein
VWQQKGLWWQRRFFEPGGNGAVASAFGNGAL